MSQPSHPARPAAAVNPGQPAIHPLHPRRLTTLRIRAFLVALDATGSVSGGMNRQSACRLRTRRPELAEVWRLALRHGWGLGDAG